MCSHGRTALGLSRSSQLHGQVYFTDRNLAGRNCLESPIDIEDVKAETALHCPRQIYSTDHTLTGKMAHLPFEQSCGGTYCQETSVVTTRF
jgi:hypothetical protein